MKLYYEFWIFVYLKVNLGFNIRQQYIGHLPDSLADKISPLIRPGERIAATERMWTQGGGIKIPCKYKLYGNDSYKATVRN